MAEILAPGFELLGRLADPLSELGQSFPEAVRVEVREARSRERLLENLADRGGGSPVTTVQT